MKHLLKKLNWKLVLIIILAALVRFGGLTWCFPHTPHPDEWNMAAAITRLNWRISLDPKFYAYGQFPLYLAYFTATIYNLIPWIKIKAINTQEAIFFLRFWSATAGVATVYLVYLISKRLLTTNYYLLATIFAAFTPGLIQISHFGTTESPLSFFFLLILLTSLKILEKPKLKYFILTGMVFGLALGTKISALIFGFPIFLVFLIQFIHVLKNKDKLKNLAVLFGKNLVLLVLLILLVLLSSPYLVLAFKESRGTLLYETSLATGTSPVFYTRQFINTTPILFQLQKIFPYVLGWPIFILGSLGFLLSLLPLIPPKPQKSLNTYYLILTTAFIVYFLPQAFLFAKWTRFMAPIFAFFPIFTAFFLSKTPSLIKNKKILTTYYLLLTTVAIIPGLLFSSIYLRPDIRFTASEWIFENVPSNSQILFDTGNVLDIPVPTPNLPNHPNLPNYTLVSFDFYHMDENPELFPKLLNYLENSDYIFVPSRRIFKNHLRFPQKYPKTARYYQLLFSGELGFEEIKKFSPFPKLKIENWSLEISDEQSEETFTVFDHPVIRIYKKEVLLNKNQYEKMFKKPLFNQW